MSVAIATSTIVQQAFRQMALEPPSSLDDESEKGIAAQEAYDEALAVCLEVADWSFASAFAELSPVASPIATDPDLPYAFALPTGAQALRAVVAGAGRWRLDRQYLRADQPGPITIRYTERITNEQQMPATFRQAVALQLAVMLAPRWVEVQGRIARLEEQLQTALTMAARADARTASAMTWSGHDSGDWASEART